MGILYCGRTPDEFDMKGIEYFKQAGELGNKEAFANLGIVYLEGPFALPNPFPMLRNSWLIRAGLGFFVSSLCSSLIVLLLQVIPWDQLLFNWSAPFPFLSAVSIQLFFFVDQHV